MSHQDEQQASTAFLNLIGDNNAQALSNFLGSFKDTAALKRLLTSEEDNENHNCLHIAAMNRSSEQVVEILLTKATEVNALKDLLNSQDINGKTPLMQCLECGSTEPSSVDKVLKKSLELFAEDHHFAKKHLALKGNTGENEPSAFALACHCGTFDESHAEASKNAKAFFEILAATNLLAEQFTTATFVDALKCGVMSPETLQIFIAEANKSNSLTSSASSSTGLLNALCSKASPSSPASSTSVFFQLWSECASVDTLIILTENLLANSNSNNDAEDKIKSLLKEVHPLDGHNLIMAACNNFNFTTPNKTDKLFTFLFQQLERHDILQQEFTRIDKAGWNVLFHACSQSQIDLKTVQFFFNTAENKKFNCLKDMLLHKDEEGRTVLMQTIADRNVSSSSTSSSEGEDNNDNDKEILEVLKLILQKSQELDIFSAVLEAVDANNENAFLIAAGASEYKEAGATFVKMLIAQCTCKEHYDSWKQLESTVDGEENPKNALKKAMDGGNEKVQKLIADPDAFEHCVKWWKESQ